MNDWFKWNGVKSTELGIYVGQQPPITYPAERVAYTDIPGRSGSLVVLEGEGVYNDLTLSVQCSMKDEDRLNEIGTWLRGGGKVEFANRRGGYYLARIANQIPFNQILRGRKNRQFTVSFRCKPFWYMDNDAPVTVGAPGFIENPGNAACEPKIAVTASGDYTLTVNGSVIEVKDGSIIIDSELRDCLTADGALLANNRVTMNEYPVLKPGANTISWSGSVTSVSVLRRVRYL